MARSMFSILSLAILQLVVMRRGAAAQQATAPPRTGLGRSANPVPYIGTDDAGNIHCNSTTGTKVGIHAPSQPTVINCFVLESKRIVPRRISFPP